MVTSALQTYHNFKIHIHVKQTLLHLLKISRFSFLCNKGSKFKVAPNFIETDPVPGT